MGSDAIELEVDSRRRLPIGRLIENDQHRFRARKMLGGDILLTPVVSVSERELAVLRNPEALASLRTGLDQAAAGQGTRYERGHFEKLAEELGLDEG